MPWLRRMLPACLLGALLSVARAGVEPAASETWWALRPLESPPIPAPESAGLSRNAIDLFLLARLEAAGLTYSPEASRPALIRRVYFDLLGLPPTPEEVAAFEADPGPNAYERLVERLLARPEYGERWARHWLDVVHYGDTHGYDKDQPRPNAWPYRDYVIRALNEDRPYARFVQEQIAGDVLFPHTRDGLEALGFIAAGPWDLIGHAEVPETKIDGQIARHLDRDNMVANTISTFNSLTVHCAQCHNHKFDPIPAEDYYRLQAVFAAVDRTNREYYDDPELNRQRARWQERERQLEREKNELHEKIASEGGAEWAELRKKLEEARRSQKDQKDRIRPAEFGYHSAIASSADEAKWVQVDLGQPVPLDKLVLRPCSDDFAGIGDGFGFPPRYAIEISPEDAFRSPVLVVDHTGADQANPGLEPRTFPLDGQPVRFIRVTATKLAVRQGDFILALAELEALDPSGRNVARGAKVSALDSIEAPVRWAKANLVDGHFPAGSLPNASAPAEIARLETALAELAAARVSAPTRQAWAAATNELASVQRALAAMPKPRLAFIGGVHHGSGAFRGTGPDGGKPRKVSILRRGDVRQPGREVAPGALSAVPGLPAQFALPAGAPEGERRQALALWLTDPRNPLTWRSIVNRVWQYHFGRGLAGTPNDFGRMGEQPSHPELLDWLAAEFRDGGQSLKKLHRAILGSAAYRQVSTVTAQSQAAVEIDSENRLLWRAHRRKLEAEALRDSILLVSGQLDARMFGPGFQDFVLEKPEHSPHYQYDQFDWADPRARRRSIYRFIVRSQPQPFMASLDCADPSMQVARRNESVSALQALALLNNDFVLTMAEHFATKAWPAGGGLPEAVRRAFASALSRPPSETELRELARFAEAHGLVNTCRLLFNLSEFNFID